LGASASPQASSSQNDILQALMSLGYSDKEATAAWKQLPADIGVSDGIKQALKALAR
jgi:Holliday junction DNA helicase RuvA